MVAPRGGAARSAGAGGANGDAGSEGKVERWVKAEPRLRSGVTVAQEDPDLAVEEIALRAGDPNFVQVLMPSKTNEPLGRKRYGPVYVAAQALNFPIAIQLNSVGRGYSPTPVGWPRDDLHDQHVDTHIAPARVASRVAGWGGAC